MTSHEIGNSLSKQRCHQSRPCGSMVGDSIIEGTGEVVNQASRDQPSVVGMSRGKQLRRLKEVGQRGHNVIARDILEYLQRLEQLAYGREGRTVHGVKTATTDRTPLDRLNPHG
jgi:hypothetical protein